MPESNKPPFRTHYLQGLQSSISKNSSAFGYSLVATADFAVLSQSLSPPTHTDIFLFLIGAVAAFAVVELGAGKLMRRDAPGEPDRVVVLAGAVCIVSVTAAVAVAWGLGTLLPSAFVWPVAAFVSSAAYLLLVALEVALAAMLDDESEENAPTKNGSDE